MYASGHDATIAYKAQESAKKEKGARRVRDPTRFASDGLALATPSLAPKPRRCDPARFATDNSPLNPVIHTTIQAGSIRPKGTKPRQVGASRMSETAQMSPRTKAANDVARAAHAAKAVAAKAAMDGLETPNTLQRQTTPQIDPACKRVDCIDDQDEWADILLDSFFRPAAGSDSDSEEEDMNPEEKQAYVSDCKSILRSLLPADKQTVPESASAPTVDSGAEAIKTPMAPNAPKDGATISPKGPSPRLRSARYEKRQQVAPLSPKKEVEERENPSPSAPKLEIKADKEDRGYPARSVSEEEIQAHKDESQYDYDDSQSPTWARGYAQAC